MIGQGSTYIMDFEIPFLAGEVEKCVVSFAQGEKEVLSKIAKVEDRTVRVKLEQGDTVKFDRGKLVLIQLRIKKANSGHITSSSIIDKNEYGQLLTVDLVFNKEVL